jgi:hypothetical protein
MTVRRWSGDMPSQPPISIRVRPHPMQKPVSGSTTQILTQGVSMAGWWGAFMVLYVMLSVAKDSSKTAVYRNATAAA